MYFMIYAGFWLIGGLLLLLGGAILGAFLHTVWKGLRSRGWPTTTGKIVSTEAATEESALMPEEGAPDALLSQTGVAYEYEIDGEKRTGNTVHVRGSLETTRSSRYEEQLASRYRPGDPVTVYCNPANPNDAALQTGIPRGLFPIAIPGTLLASVGLLMILIPTGMLKFLWQPWTPGIVFLLPGAVMFLFGLQSLWTAMASRFWPTTEATITRCGLVRVSPKRDSYQPDVAFRYVVNGVTYSSGTLNWGRFGEPYADAQQTADRYPLGETVLVYYHPTKPHRAVIEPGGGWMYLLVIFLGVVFAAAGTFFLINAPGG